MCCWWSSPLLLRLVGLLDKLINIDIKFEELLPNKVFDELVVVNEFFIVNLGAAFQFHFLGVILPLDLYLDQGSADQLQHLVWITKELHAHMVRSLLLNLHIQLTLVCSAVHAEWILNISMFGQSSILWQIEPNLFLVHTLATEFHILHLILSLGHDCHALVCLILHVNILIITSLEFGIDTI